MKVSVQSIHFDADKKLLAFIQRKVDKIDQFVNNIVKGEVYLRLQKSEDRVNKIAEIRLKVPGNLLFVKEQCKTFEEATDLALDSLLRQVNKHKTKSRTRLSNHKEILTNQIHASV